MTLALLRAARFEVLNQTKLTLISKEFVARARVPSMEEMHPHERWFGEWIQPKEDVPLLKLGVPATKSFADSQSLAMALNVMRNDNYLLALHPETRSISVVLHTDSGHKDIIKAILHAMRLDKELCSSHEENQPPSDSPTRIRWPSDPSLLQSRLASSRTWMHDNFPRFAAELDSMDWQSDAVFWGDSGNRVKWEREVEGDKDRQAGDAEELEPNPDKKNA
ncbi:hypothetical protein HK104_002363 [Borealophlyctis nickersoniae]|nr:hypothetical protein HK104_002363 [Borealophlyctis nickersoniae]